MTLQSLFNTWSPAGLCDVGHNRLIITVFVPAAIETGVLGTIRRWKWYRRLEDGRPTLQAIPGSPPSCSAAVRDTTEGECGLFSKHVHSQLAHCNPLFHFLNFNVLVPTGFVVVGQ